MKLSDYLIQYLVDHKVKDVFIVMGGAASHIVDSLGKNTKIRYICMQHEQAAAMAADVQARLTGHPSAAVATSGPGATNLITGTCTSWFDSIPCIFLTGQVALSETKGERKIRQLGFQETDIIEIVKSVTKYAVMVKDPSSIKYHLDKAFYLAKNGRPGPVWLDLPLNVQHSEINPDSLRGFNPKLEKQGSQKLKQQVKKTLELIAKASRPIILAGHGIRIARAIPEFEKLINALGWPVVSTWNGIDILAHDDPLYVGQFGVYGARAANFAVQNSDLLISIGSRLDTRQTGNHPESFARAAKKIAVDIDQAELAKNWVKIDLAVNADAKDFLSQIAKHLKNPEKTRVDGWWQKIKDWQNKFPVILPEFYKQKDSVNPYIFIRALSKELNNDDIILVDSGATTVWTFQAFKVKKGQRLINPLGNFPMGWAIPAGIGAWFATGKKRVICIAGDGAMQMNIQELQTIAYHKIPLKIFVINNHSYGIVKQFQDLYFDSRYEGTSYEKGYSCPDFLKIARDYNLSTSHLASNSQIGQKITKCLSSPGPSLCEVLIDDNQKIIPKLAAIKTAKGYVSKPIEDQLPYLKRSVLYENMIIDTIS